MTATGTECGIFVGGNLVINGGKVTAMAMGTQTYAKGIRAIYNITLGWTNATDFIQANSYDASGTVPRENETYAIEGKWLYPYSEDFVYKSFTGYGTGNDKWVFIASPVSGSTLPSEVGNLVATPATDYDLYRFNQSDANGKEWQNYKAHTTDFNLINGQGYLYATKETKTLVFAGSFNTDNTKIVDLVYDNAAELKGWNLVGNPFAVDAYVNKPFYKMNEAGTGIEAVDNYSGTVIPACTGIMVQATGENETIKFGTSSPVTAPNNGGLNVTLTQANTRSNAIMDNAIVSFNEGSELGKFYFGTQNANIYIPQHNEEYAIAYSKGQGEMPLNFKAKENGIYTLTVSAPLTTNLSTLTSPGVYVLRLIDGENVRTQKIVVR